MRLMVHSRKIAHYIGITRSRCLPDLAQGKEQVESPTNLSAARPMPPIPGGFHRFSLFGVNTNLTNQTESVDNRPGRLRQKERARRYVFSVECHILDNVG